MTGDLAVSAGCEQLRGGSDQAFERESIAEWISVTKSNQDGVRVDRIVALDEDVSSNHHFGQIAGTYLVATDSHRFQIVLDGDTFTHRVPTTIAFVGARRRWVFLAVKAREPAIPGARSHEDLLGEQEVVRDGRIEGNGPQQERP